MQQQSQFKSGGHYAFNAPANGASFNGGTSYTGANGRAPSFRRGGGARGGPAATGSAAGGAAAGGGAGQYYGRANSWNNAANGSFNGEPQKSHGIEKRIFNDGELAVKHIHMLLECRIFASLKDYFLTVWSTMS